MKTKFFTTLLLVVSTIIFSKAQTTFNLYQVSYYSPGGAQGVNIFCGTPKLINLSVYGNGTNYTPGQIINLYVNFGDGKDTTFTTTFSSGLWFDASFPHWYNTTGSFNVVVTATAPDFKTGTSQTKDPIIIESPCQTRVLMGNKDSLYYYYDKCEVPQKVNINFGGSTMMYNSASDSITIKASFGDGHDTIFKSGLYNIGGDYQQFYGYISHNFTSKGNYSMQIVGIGPDGKSDTITKMNAFLLKDTCGNILGRVYQDMNGDCQYNIGEPLIKYASVQLLENNMPIDWTNTNSKGEYWFDVPGSGNYSVKLYYGYSYYGSANICPASGVHSIASVPSLNNDFGLVCSGFDLTCNASGWRFRPGFMGGLYLFPGNKNCVPTAGTVKLILDPKLTFNSSYKQTPTINGDTLIFNYNSLSSLQYYWENYEYLTVMTSTSAQIGDSVCIKVIITPQASDTDPSNNIQTYCFPVTNSWDPNMKEVHAEGMNPAGNVAPNKTLTYTVHFQNNGTDTAYNISVLDTLDNNLNLQTFKILGSSHEVEPVILESNIMKFNFNNIMLPDDKVNEPASHGSVTYSIEQKQNLPLGTKINNTAHIFFDFNPAIITNTVITTIDTSTFVSSIVDYKKLVRTYPNPATNSVRVNFNNIQTGRVVKIVDLLGNEVINKRAEGISESLDMSKLPEGIYILLVNTEPSLKEKIIKIK